MKNSTITLFVIGLALFFMFPAAMAASNKPPKSICWELDSDGDPLDGSKLYIATKYSGMRLKDSTGIVKLYWINGALKYTWWYSIVGSGYWDESDGGFEGTIMGHILDFFVSCQLHVGSQHLHCAVAPALDSHRKYDLEEIDCEFETLD